MVKERSDRIAVRGVACPYCGREAVYYTERDPLGSAVVSRLRFYSCGACGLSLSEFGLTQRRRLR